MRDESVGRRGRDQALGEAGYERMAVWTVKPEPRQLLCTCTPPVAFGAPACSFSIGTVKVFRERETLTYNSTEINY